MPNVGRRIALQWARKTDAVFNDSSRKYAKAKQRSLCDTMSIGCDTSGC